MSDTGNEVGWLKPQSLTGNLGKVSYTPAVGQTYDEWDRDGKRLAIINTATRWALGDWMNAGGVFKDDARWQAEAIPTRTEYWWNESMRVSNCVPVENRHPKLSWYHHQVIAALDPQEQRFLLEECFDRKWDIDQLRAQAALVRNGHTPLEIEPSNETSAYRAAKGGDIAPARKLADVAREAQDAKKAAAILKRQERLDRQERKRAEVAERKAAQARGEKPPPRVVIPEAEPVHYDVLLADPWRDEGMTLTEAIALPVKDLIANNALMFMWSTVEKLSESLVLLETWGFDRRSQLVWRKTKATVTPYTREQHELVLIGTRGKPALPAERPMSVFDGAAPQGGHPDAILFQIIEKMLLPGRKRVVVLPSGAVPLAYRDRWHVWDAQPKGNQEAA